MVVHTLHICLPVVEVHSTWSIIRDFGHNDNFVFLGFCVTWSLSAPWWFLEENLMKEIMIFWGAEMDSSERAGVYG